MISCLTESNTSNWAVVFLARMQSLPVVLMAPKVNCDSPIISSLNVSHDTFVLFIKLFFHLPHCRTDLRLALCTIVYSTECIAQGCQ